MTPWAIIGVICGLFAFGAVMCRSGRKSAALEQAKKEALEREKVDSIIQSNSDLGRSECLERLRGGTDKK